MDDKRVVSARKKMVSALKSLVVPELRRLGFTGRFPDFRRILDSGTDLLSFQLHDYDTSFVIEIAQRQPGAFKTIWGALLSPQELTTFHLELTERYRIQPREGGGTDSWFQFDEDRCEVAASILPFVELADRWFKGNRNSSSIFSMADMAGKY